MIILAEFRIDDAVHILGEAAGARFGWRDMVTPIQQLFEPDGDDVGRQTVFGKYGTVSRPFVPKPDCER
jgi:hypothetical protein